MSKKGGYLIVDFKGLPLTSGEASAIEGVYAVVANPYNKPTLVSGLVVGDVAYPDFYAPFTPNEGSFMTSLVIGGKTIQISIDSDDNTTVTVIE